MELFHTVPSHLISIAIWNNRLDFLYDDTGSLLGFLYDGESYYYVKNLQGDITGILDSDGNMVVEYEYDAWGKVELVSGTMSSTLGHLNPFRYRGYYYDGESGLYYLNSRYYACQARHCMCGRCARPRAALAMRAPAHTPQAIIQKRFILPASALAIA